MPLHAITPQLTQETPEQKDLFEQLMRVLHNHTYGDAKLAAYNALAILICATSSNADEAILQWNELSTAFDRDVEARIDLCKLVAFRAKFNGDK